jgi:hypothetical protein
MDDGRARGEGFHIFKIYFCKHSAGPRVGHVCCALYTCIYIAISGTYLRLRILPAVQRPADSSEILARSLCR